MERPEVGQEGHEELPLLFLTTFMLLAVFVLLIFSANLSLGARNLMEEETGLASMQLVWNTYSFHLFPQKCGEAMARFGPAPVGQGPGAFELKLPTLKGTLDCTLWPYSGG